jgi:hypothetical protein
VGVLVPSSPSTWGLLLPEARPSLLPPSAPLPSQACRVARWSRIGRTREGDPADQGLMLGPHEPRAATRNAVTERRLRWIQGVL